MAPLQVEVVTDGRRFRELEGDWSALESETPYCTGFQSFAWTEACRAHLAGPRRRLFTLVVRDGRETIGIVPAELGARGDLGFIGAPVSNYQGPLYRAARLHDVIAALAEFLTAGSQDVRLLDLGGLVERSPFLAAWGAVDVAGWASPRIIRTATCPWVDLSAGWEATYRRRTGGARTQLGRKWKALGRLGHVDVVETGDPDEVRRALLAMVRLFAERWAGRRESGGFAGRRQRFHEDAAPALARAGGVRLSLLKVDGLVVAFSYGIATRSGTASYVLGHDGALDAYSPGALLLLRLLERACERGDAEYDFSLGDERYKEEWASGRRGVFRVLHWRRGSIGAVRGALRGAGAGAWVAARSLGWLRDLKRDGIGRRLLGAPGLEARSDAPGVPAGDGSRWTVYRVAATARSRHAVSITSWAYGELRRALSPRLLEAAAERSFRNDTLLVLRDGPELVGIVWQACAARRTLVTYGADVGSAEPVYYHPAPAPGHGVDDVVRALASVAADGSGCVVVARDGDLSATVAQRLATFVADLRFKPVLRPLTTLVAWGDALRARAADAPQTRS